MIVAGDVKHAHLVQLGKRHYGDWAKGMAQIQVPSEPEQKGEKRFAVKWQNGSLPILQLGYKVDAFDPKDTDNVSLEVISEAVFGPTSALYKKLVIDDKKVISLGGGYPPHRDRYLFTISAAERRGGFRSGGDGDSQGDRDRQAKRACTEAAVRNPIAAALRVRDGSENAVRRGAAGDLLRRADWPCRRGE